MSKHNRERRLLWKLKLHKKRLGRKATHDEINRAKAAVQMAANIKEATL